MLKKVLLAGKWSVSTCFWSQHKITRKYNPSIAKPCVSWPQIPRAQLCTPQRAVCQVASVLVWDWERMQQQDDTHRESLLAIVFYECPSLSFAELTCSCMTAGHVRYFLEVILGLKRMLRSLEDPSKIKHQRHEGNRWDLDVYLSNFRRFSLDRPEIVSVHDLSISTPRNSTCWFWPSASQSLAGWPRH